MVKFLGGPGKLLFFIKKIKKIIQISQNIDGFRQNNSQGF